MPDLTFHGETHDEIVQKVRRWLASVDGAASEQAVAPTDVVNASAELTKDALSVIARSAPGPVAESDVVKALTTMGYKATDATRDAALSGLDALDTATGGSAVKKVAKAGRQAVYEMNAEFAKQVLKTVVRD